MSFQEWIDNRSRDWAYFKASAKFRHRIHEVEAMERAAEKARGIPLKPPDEPDLPAFPLEYDRDRVLPDFWVCSPDREFGWPFDVQGCLHRLGGWISTYQDPISKESAAQAISKAAYIWGVNPRLLIASLQREKGLIRRKTAPKQKDMDWAAGVGAYDSRPWDEKYKGFGTQIIKMAETYRKDFEKWKPGRTIRVNFRPFSRLSIPQNAGTFTLLEYTPHDSASLLTWKIMRFFFSK